VVCAYDARLAAEVAEAAGAAEGMTGPVTQAQATVMTATEEEDLSQHSGFAFATLGVGIPVRPAAGE
jgi:hypothetical protein